MPGESNPDAIAGGAGSPDTRVNLGLLVLQVGGMAAVFGLALFGTAGTLAWPAAWLYLIGFFSFVVGISAWLIRYNPELMRERMTGVGRADQKPWDKLFLVAASLVFYSWLVFMPLDAVRFRWSNVPLWVQVVGAILLLSSFVLFFLVFRENSYLSPAVRIQRERGQTVISTGPYAYVRHPMYAAVIPFGVGTSLLLGSWFGLVPVALLMGLVRWRAGREEQTLRADLQGYPEYMQTVRFRFIPFIW